MTKNILVVDDDPLISKYIVKVLNDNGYETCTAADGLEAMDKLKSEKPALITLDLAMFGEWGPRFYRKFNKDPDYKDTPVIVITGLSSGEYAIRDAVATLKKPFDPDELMGVVRETIGAPN